MMEIISGCSDTALSACEHIYNSARNTQAYHYQQPCNFGYIAVEFSGNNFNKGLDPYLQECCCSRISHHSVPPGMLMAKIG